MSEITAYHEAGHAVAAVILGARVGLVTIEPDRDDAPARYGEARLEWPPGRFTDREIRRRSILVALAGPVAEMIHREEPLHPGFVAEWAADWEQAWQAAADLFPDKRRRLAHLEQAPAELYQLLHRDDHWAALAAIVDHLLAHETLEGEEIEDVVRQWLP